ncbi:Phage protein [Bacillus sp. GeD10]|nr:Phage protein [Bacillus sp. GeD10]
MILEDLAYPEWLIRKKQKAKEHELLGIKVELTDQIEKFEMRIVKKMAES